MDWLTFVSSAIKSLAWPGLIFAILMLFRKQFGAILPALASRLKSAEGFGAKVDFSDKLAAAEENVPPAVLAAEGEAEQLRPPHGATETIIKAWEEFTTWCRMESGKRRRPAVASDNSIHVIHDLISVIPAKSREETMTLFNNLLALRMIASSNPNEITANDVIRFGRLLAILKAQMSLGLP